MFTVWRRLWDLPGWMRILMLGQVVSSAGALAWIYLALYLVTDRGMIASAAGLIAAGYGAGLIAGNFGGGWFGDRFGVRRCLLFSQIAWFVACVVVPAAPTAALAVLVCSAGLCAGASRPLAFAMVTSALPTERRREGMALSRTASNLGFSIGPPVGALLATYNFGLIFLVDAITTAVLAAITWRVVPRDATSRPTAPSLAAARPGSGPAAPGLWRSLRANPSVLAILATVVVVDTVYRQILTPLPLMLHDMGEPTLAYGLLLAANGALIVLFEAPIAVLLRNRAAVSVIAAGYALVGVGFLVIGAAPGLVTAALAIVVISLGEMLYKPTAPAYLADCAPADMQGRYQSLYAGASVSGYDAGTGVGRFRVRACRQPDLAGLRGDRRAGRDHVVATGPAQPRFS